VHSFNDKDANGPMSPMSDGYTNSMADSNIHSQRPAKILEEYEATPSPVSGPLKEKRSKERNKDRSHRKDRARDREGEPKDKETRRRERLERKERHREREKENGGERSNRSSRTKLKEIGGEYLEADFGRSELDQTPSTATRSISNNGGKLKGPRPPSSHSQKERSSERRREKEKDRRSSGEGWGDGMGLETSGTVVKKHRVKSSHGVVGVSAGEFFN